MWSWWCIGGVCGGRERERSENSSERGERAPEKVCQNLYLYQKFETKMEHLDFFSKFGVFRVCEVLDEIFITFVLFTKHLVMNLHFPHKNIKNLIIAIFFFFLFSSPSSFFSVSFLILSFFYFRFLSYSFLFYFILYFLSLSFLILSPYL